MESSSSLFGGLTFVVEYSLACLLFLFPLSRKPRFPQRFSLFFALHLFFGCAALYAVSSGAVALLISFAIGIGGFLLCADIPFSDAVFGASCAFAVQHMSYAIFSCLSIALFRGTEQRPELEALTFLLVSPLCYLFAARRIPISGRYQVSVPEAVRSAVVILFFAYYLSMKAERYCASDSNGSLALLLIIRVYAIFCCVLVLWTQISVKEAAEARSELRTQQALSRKAKEQYETSRENIRLINRRCHDLKRQIAALRDVESGARLNDTIEQVERSVMIYDSAVKTGNEVLDTILTERSLRCEQEGISWTCMADGEKLSFLDSADLYTILENALDNAMECVRALSDPERRVISVNIRAKPRMVVLQVENYYEREIPMSGGFPDSSPKKAGYGLKSIRRTAEKYGGSLSIDTENHIFLLSVMIPTP